MNVLSKFNLSDDIAVITGGAGLLGLQHCEALLEAGATVIILDVDEKALSKSKNIFSNKYGERFYSLHADITKEDQIISAN